MRGLSEAIGSWKIIWIARLGGAPRRPAQSRRVRAAVAHGPSELGAGCRRRCAPSVDLPQPDSPTRPTHLALGDLELDVVDRPHDLVVQARAPKTVGDASARVERADEALRDAVQVRGSGAVMRAARASSGAADRASATMRVVAARGAVASSRPSSGITRAADVGRVLRSAARKAQPGGRSHSDGVMPGIWRERLAARVAARHRADQARGVGMRSARRALSATEPSSTIRPAYITRDPVGEAGDDGRGRA